MRIVATFVQAAKDRAGPALLALAVSLALAWAAAAFPGVLRSFLSIPRAGLESFLGARCVDEPDGSVIAPDYGSRLDMSCSGLGTLCIVEFAVFLVPGGRLLRPGPDDGARGRRSRPFKRLLAAWGIFIAVMALVLAANAFRVLFAHATLPLKESLGLVGFWGHRLEGFIIMGFAGFIAVYAAMALSDKRRNHALVR